MAVLVLDIFLLCCILEVSTFHMGLVRDGKTHVCLSTPLSSSSSTSADIDTMTQAFLDRYSSTQHSSLSLATSVLFPDIRFHRADVNKIQQKKFSIAWGDSADIDTFKPKYFKSGPTKLVDTKKDDDNNKTIQVVDHFRFVIDEKQVERVMEKGTGYVEAKNVGAGTDRGLEQKMNISSDMIKLLKNDALKVKGDSGKLIYRLEMNYDDFVQYTGGNVDDNEDVYSKMNVEKNILEGERSSSFTKQSMIIDSQSNNLHDKNSESRNNIMKIERDDNIKDNEIIYSNVKEKIELKYEKYTHAKMEDHRNYVDDIPLVREFNGKDNLDIAVMNHAIRKAYLVNRDKKLNVIQWFKNIKFKWTKMDNDVEVGYSALFLMIATIFTMACKVSTEYFMLLIRRIFAKSPFFQRQKFQGLKFVIFALLFLRILLLDFFDTEENKT